MPLAELPPEVAAQISGEEDIDPIIQQQVADDREGRVRRDLPEEFLQRVFSAQEYAFRHQGLDDDECCRRRGHVNEWLDTLRWGDRYNEWCGKISRHLRELTPEEEAAEAVRAEVKKAERKVANERAESLLRSVLAPKQLKELKRRGYFHVVVEARRFRITRGRSHNIKEVDARGRILRTLCAHPVEQVPDADTMLAQKLWLEGKPEDFFKLANVVRVRRPRRMPPGVGRPVINTQGIDRLVMDRLAEHLHQEAEARARREWAASEQDMRILEDAALATPAAGVQPAQAAEPVLVPEGNVRAA